MAGNVWEWTRSHGRYKYPYKPEDGRENLNAPDNVYRVLGGGAFISHDWRVRCAYRRWSSPDLRLRNFGFRVVMQP